MQEGEVDFTDGEDLPFFEAAEDFDSLHGKDNRPLVAFVYQVISPLLKWFHTSQLLPAIGRLIYTHTKETKKKTSNTTSFMTFIKRLSNLH